MTNTSSSSGAWQPPAQPRLSCADCGFIFGKDPRGLPWDDRWPCPRCGSLKRAVQDDDAEPDVRA